MSEPLVVALNPSVDVEWRLDRVLPIEKNVIRDTRRWPGGKGVNVARWVQHLGNIGRLLLPLGGDPGTEMRTGLRAWKIPSTVVPIRDRSRVNVIVTPDSGPQIRFNEPGPLLTRADQTRVLQALRRSLAKASLLVLSGSLPRGLASNSYAACIRLARRRGVRTILDCEGASLAAAVAARPFPVKPNEHELATWRGRPLRSWPEVRQAAAALSDQTQGWVLLSLGRKGAVLLHSRERVCLKVRPPAVQAVNTVGAGDALLAAVTCRLSAGAPPEDWLRWGVATGTTMTTLPAGRLPEPRRIAALAEKLVVHRCPLPAR